MHILYRFFYFMLTDSLLEFILYTPHLEIIVVSIAAASALM